ncbi:MAG: lytic transglycosylase domain-containing protein, partial [Proteobacteria bacterium]|nr:lytic transglycosylase domain-containing protein [Pseudomonadota bacterium]
MPAHHLTARMLAITVGVATLAKAGPDEAVLAAHAAFRNGEVTKLQRQVAATEGHLLAPWIEYWRLNLRLEEAAAQDIHDFLSRHAGTYLADRLRADWLKVLGKRADWERFGVELAPLTLDDRDVHCYALAARLVRDDHAALEEAQGIWLKPRALGEGCEAAAEQMLRLDALPPALVWARARALASARRAGDAQRALRSLP